MRRLWPLTVRGTGALILGLACIIAAGRLGLVELVWFGVLLLTLTAASMIVVWAARGRADVTRVIAPRRPVAGGEIDVAVRVLMRTALPASGGRWRDGLSDGLTGDADGVFPTIPSGLSRGEREARVTYSVTAERRGIHWLGSLELTSTDPFGIARRTVALGEPTRVVVTPAVVELPSLAGVPGRSGGADAVRLNRLGQGSDDVIARPWAPGDSMRRIHWRASAHRDELMVRQEEQESSPEATVVLDRGVARWSPEAMESGAADEAFESAVRACASVVARLAHDGYAVDVCDADGALLCDRIDPGDAGGLEAAMLMLATVQARLDDQLLALADLFAGETTGPLIVVTGRLDEADAATLSAVGHHSSFPVLLTTSPGPGALDAASGWAAAQLHDDVSRSWHAAVDRRLGHVGA